MLKVTPDNCLLQMNADFCNATLKNSINTFRRRKHSLSTSSGKRCATVREQANEEYVDEFGRKRKRIDHEINEDNPKTVVNFMRPKAPGYYNFSAEEEIKQQQILAITSCSTSEPVSADTLRKQRIRAARERNEKIRALKHHSSSLLKKENCKNISSNFEHQI